MHLSILNKYLLSHCYMQQLQLAVGNTEVNKTASLPMELTIRHRRFCLSSLYWFKNLWPSFKTSHQCWKESNILILLVIATHKTTGSFGVMWLFQISLHHFICFSLVFPQWLQLSYTHRWSMHLSPLSFYCTIPDTFFQRKRWANLNCM